MSKIIQRGQAHINGPWQFRCGKCLSTIEFDSADKRPDVRDGSYYMCPVCQGFISSKVVEK